MELSVIRKQTCNNSTRLAFKRWSIFYRLYFRLLLESCNNFISRSLRCNFENGADNGVIVFVSSPSPLHRSVSRIYVSELEWTLPIDTERIGNWPLHGQTQGWHQMHGNKMQVICTQSIFSRAFIRSPAERQGDEKLVQRLIQLFSSTEIFSKRRKIYACWRKSRVNCTRKESDPCLTWCCKTCGTNNLTSTFVSMRKIHTFKKDCRSVVRKQTCHNSTFLTCKRWGIFYRFYFRLLLESCNNFISKSLRCNFGNGADNGAIVFVSSPSPLHRSVSRIYVSELEWILPIDTEGIGNWPLHGQTQGWHQKYGNRMHVIWTQSMFSHALIRSPAKRQGDEKLVQRLIQLFSSTEIFSKRRKIYACWRKTWVNCKREESDPCLTRCCKTCGTNNLKSTFASMRKRHIQKRYLCYPCPGQG